MHAEPVSATRGPLRIAMIAACPLPAPRGTPVRIQRIAEQLARRGHEVHLFTYGLATAGTVEGVHVHRTMPVPGYRGDAPGPHPAKFLALDPLLARLFRRAAGARSFDIVHAHHVEGLLCALAGRRRARVPLVYDVHTLLGQELPFYGTRLSGRVRAAVGAWLDGRLPRLADAVIAVSAEIRGAILGACGERAPPVDIIPNGIEPEFLALGARAARPGAADPPTWVYAGNLAGFQGVDVLLHAFARARVELPALRLRLLTDSDFAAYRPLALELGVENAIDVERCEWQQLPARLAGAHVAINPRQSCSGVPQKLVNYMAAGCAIASFRGSAKHVVDGRDALVVDDGDIDGLAAAALRLLRDAPLAAALGQAAHREAERQFSWDGVAARIEQVYARTLGQRT